MTELRISLRRVGRIDPASLDDARAAGAYRAWEKAQSMAPEQIIDQIEASGLRGRGGAGFPAASKWRAAARERAAEKVVVCNAEEGEPGTFKDRAILEGDPHAVIEGMLICARAIGATRGIIYCRRQYPRAIGALVAAARDAKESGVAGDVDITVHASEGAYVCGEASALLNSLEGLRGEPRIKPPHLTQAGYHARPTVVNNVETFALVAPIIERGGAWFSALGDAAFPGTKLMCVSGDVAQPGVYEVPTDTPLSALLESCCGGCAHDGDAPANLKFVQVGGSSCALLRPDELDVACNPASFAEHHAQLGSGAVRVFDDTRRVADLLAETTAFFRDESCGQCIPCREGTLQLQLLAAKVRAGQATGDDAALMRRLCSTMTDACFCPLGRSATVAVTSAFEKFPEEFPSEVVDGFTRSSEVAK